MASSSSSSAPNPRAAALLRELAALVADAEKIIGENSGDEASLMEKLRTHYADAQERLGEIYETTRRRVVSGARSADAAIRSHPYQSLGLALGAGLVAGLLLGRRFSCTHE